jgi:hypothetical protein
MIQADSSQAEDRFVFIAPETIKTLSDNNASILPPIDQIKVEVGWREVVPKWLQNGLCYFCFSSSNSSLATEDPGYFTQAWVDCGLLNGLTEVVRAGYARILCLRALSMGLSPTELARALAITGTTAVATFWLSDIADRNRRLSSFLRYCFLFAHFFKFLLSNYFYYILVFLFLDLGTSVLRCLAVCPEFLFLHFFLVLVKACLLVCET